MSARVLSTERDRERFKALWRAGHSREEIASVFGVADAGTISKWAKGLGLSSRAERRIPPEREDEFREAYMAGTMTTRLAAQFACSLAYITATAVRLGLPARPRGSRAATLKGERLAEYLATKAELQKVAEDELGKHVMTAGCARCGWRSPEMPVYEARREFEEHECAKAA